jgi:hypothetical protein
MKLKLNNNFTYKGKAHKKGDIITVADDGSIPLDAFWRGRLKDSTIDNCVEIVKKSNNNKKSK